MGKFDNFTIEQATATFNLMPQGIGQFEAAAYAFSMVLLFRSQDKNHESLDALWERGLSAMTVATGQDTPVLKDEPEMEPLMMVAVFQSLPYGPGGYFRAAYGLWASLALFHRATHVRLTDDTYGLPVEYATYARELSNHGMLALVAARGEEDAA